VTYTLDTLGRRTGMTATGQSPITYGFTPIDQIASITQGSQTSSFTYDPLNRMSRRSLPNNTTTDWSFDDAGSLTSLVSKKSGVTFDSHLYTPDAVGQILHENHNGTLDVFGYDDLYRLTSATVSGTSYRWSYDNNGNRLTQDKGLDHTSYVCDQCDCFLSVNGRVVTGDANGSATSYNGDTYTWDVRNRLVKLTRPGLTVEFTYDPFGNRTSKKVNGTLTQFLLDGDSVVSEVTGTTTVNTLQSPVIDQPLARNGRFFAPNELGSTTKLTDALGGVVQSYDYSPFGETTASTGEANPFQYAGRENDGTGLYYNRHRYYVPEWGRFMSEHPLGFAGGMNR
jgi:RHS repeat-associated protein